MLHAHVPEGMKSFGKHLFATFLGLLMALGLESCHQQHVQSARAHSAMAAVRSELESNRKDVAIAKAAVKRNFARMANILKAAEALKGRKTEPAEKPEFKLDLELAELPSAAWDAAVAAQIVHNIPFEQVQALSNVYRSQRLLEVQQGILVEDVQRLSISALAQGLKDDLKSLDSRQLDEVMVALRPVLVRLRTLQQMHENTLKDMDAALKILK